MSVRFDFISSLEKAHQIFYPDLYDEGMKMLSLIQK